MIALLQQVSAARVEVNNSTIGAIERGMLVLIGVERGDNMTAAEPDTGRRLLNYLVEQARARHAPVASGRFGADMQVSLVNDGPVTFWLQVQPNAHVAQKNSPPSPLQ